MDNADWTAAVTFLDFLRDIGKHFSVNQMVAKESVRARMEDREVGISYTEFSYMLLQAYDFYHLAKRAELRAANRRQRPVGQHHRRHRSHPQKAGASHASGLTLPLITKADGTKFGKTEGGAVWLDPASTSVYRFYQFWIQTDDRDVIRYLKYFTFLSREEIGELEAQACRQSRAPAKRISARQVVTAMIHGEGASADAVRASGIMFGGGLEGIAEATFQDVVGEVPSKQIEKAQLDGAGKLLVELLVLSDLCASKGQARKDLEGGGVYLGNLRETDTQRNVEHKTCSSAGLAPPQRQEKLHRPDRCRMICFITVTVFWVSRFASTSSGMPSPPFTAAIPASARRVTSR